MQKQTDRKAGQRAALVRRRVGMGVIYTLLGVWGIFVLFPFYWMLLTSVKSYGEYSSEYVPKLFTLSPTLENYFKAFTAVPFPQDI